MLLLRPTIREALAMQWRALVGTLVLGLVLVAFLVLSCQR